VRQFSVGWWNDLARAIFGFQEHTPLALEDAIQAVAVFEDDRPEWAFVKHEVPFCTIDLSLAAQGAGEFGYIGIHNPLTSGVLGVVEQAHHSTASAALVQMQIGVEEAVFLGTILTSVPVFPLLDTRYLSPTFAGAGGMRLISGSFTAAEIAARVSMLHGTLTARNTTHDGHTSGVSFGPRFKGWVLAPGGFLLMMHAVANQVISAYFVGRERPLHKGTRA